MKRTSLFVAVIVAGLLMGSRPASAHHGTSASYDLNNPVELTGVVKEFVWANPHARMFVNVTDKDGKVVEWGIEMRPAPNGLSRIGWTRHTFQAGNKITITVFPSRFGTPTGVGEPNFPILKNGEKLPGTGTTNRAGAAG